MSNRFLGIADFAEKAFAFPLDVVNDNVDGGTFDGRLVAYGFRVLVGAAGATWGVYSVHVPPSPYEGYTVDICCAGNITTIYVQHNPGVGGGQVLIFTGLEGHTYRFIFLKGAWRLHVHSTLYTTWEGNTIPVANGGTGATTAPAARLNLDVAVAVPETHPSSTILLSSANTMSVCRIRGTSSDQEEVHVSAIANIKAGDTWEVCQMGVEQLVVVDLAGVGETITLLFPDGQGPYTPGQYSTIFICVDEIASPTAATLLVTGGVP